MPDIHLAGMVSGMDIQGTIDKLLDLRVRSITKLEEKNISLQADLAAWTDIGGSFANLTDSLYALRSFDTWNKQTATSSSGAQLSATATGSAVIADYNIAISKVAQAHSIAADALSDLGLSSSSEVMVGVVAGLSDGDQFTIQGETITINASDTMTSLMTKINDASANMAASDKVTASILADRIIITKDVTGSAEITIADTTGSPLTDLGLLHTVTQKPQAPSGSTLWLEMQDNTGPAVADSSAYGNDGVEVNGAIWDPSGKFDGAYLLDGVDDAITIDQSPENDGFQSFTWSAWIKSTGTGQAIMSYGDKSDGAGVTLQMTAGGLAEAVLDDGSTQVVATGTTNISDGAWHLVTITNDGASLRLYVDGNASPEATDDTSGLGFITTNDNDKIDIGRTWDAGAYTDNFAGSLDEVMIFNRNLSSAEVSALYSSTTTTTFKNELVEAQDAEFTVNGASVARSTNTDITDVVSGVSLNILGVTSSDITLNIEQDTDTPKSAINDFITSYNYAAAKLESYVDINLDDPRNPIVGELQGDTLVGSLLFNLRRLVTDSKSLYMDATNASYTYNGRTGIMDSLEDMGIWTSGKENRIEITDETKMDYMLVNYFDETEQLFRGVSGGAGFDHGVAEDLYDYSYGVSTSLTGQIDVRKSALQQESGRYLDKIEKMYSELDDYEQTLWSQFGVMEEIMAKFKGQTDQLLSQLGGSK